MGPGLPSDIEGRWMYDSLPTVVSCLLSVMDILSALEGSGFLPSSTLRWFLCEAFLQLL